MYKRIVIDLEANGLLEPMLDFTQRPLKLKDTAKLWCISVRCIDTDKSFLMVPEELLEEHKEALSSITAVPLSRENLAKMVHNHVEEVIGHNIIKYDLPVLQLFGVIDYSIGYPDSTLFGKKVRITDTLLLSKLSNADRLGGHSLKNFGKQGSNQKIEFHDFSKFSPEMAIYCDMDTIVGKDTYFYLMKEMGEGWWEAPYLMEAKLADLTLQQELFGFHYDAELSRRNKKELDELLEERYNKVSPNIPPRPLNKTESKRFTPPAIKTIGNLSYNSKVESILQAIGATYLSEAEVFTYKGKEYPLSYLKGIEKYIPPAKVHTKSGALTAAAKKFLASIGSEYNPINDSFEFEGREYPMTYQGCVLDTLPEPDVVLSSHMTAFLERIGASYDPATHKYTFEGREYSLDYEECVKESLEADIKDLAHIKWYLTELGWEPSQWNMRDLTRDIHKKVLPRDKFEETVRRYASNTMESPFKALRLKLLELPESTTEEQLYNFLINKDTKMLKVPTTPPLRVGATKELCPNLSKLAEDSHIEFIKDLVEFYTYQHRRNSIGGGLDEEGEESKGFESYVRADGRISTPVDTLGTATSRMGHKVVANIPRVSSLYGEKMRALFCASPPGKEGHHIQYGFDFASLEAMIEGHYVLQYPGGEEMLSALLAEKPNSLHCINARKLGVSRDSAKAISYGFLYNGSYKTTLNEET